MTARYVIWTVLTLLALSLAGFGAWIFSLPTPSGAKTPTVPSGEMTAMLAALKPTQPGRPLIAVVGINDATETNDYLMTTGILRRADIADVVMLATRPGPVQLYPALKVMPDATIARFDTTHPEGADYIIVPAMGRDDDPAILAWLRDQANKGAFIFSVCAGAKVIGAAGLLDGKRATTHWYYVKELLDRNPSINYLPDRRVVVDGNVATTTGITAAIPAMLILVEAIAGHQRAVSVAHDLGVDHWNTRHASSAFRLTRPFATTVLGNKLAFWNHEQFGIELQPGMDEVTLALVADAWSRTYRSKAVTFAATNEPVETRNGIHIIPDGLASSWPDNRRVTAYPDQTPTDALNQVLDAIAGRYGKRTANVVSMQLEYPRHPDDE